jgi:uncharacterized protein YbjT (DUF2867 family)
MLRFLTALICLAAAATQPVYADILVFGGSGRLGSEVVKNLLAADEDVVVFVRETSDRSRLNGLDVSYAIGDLLDADSIAAVFEDHDIDAVINAVALRQGESSPYVIGEENIRAATQNVDLSHMILFSATGAGDSKDAIPPHFYKNFEETYVNRGRSEEIIKSSGTPYTFIRLGIVHDMPATGQAYLAEEPKLGPITRGDAAVLAVDCLRAAQCLNKTLHAVDDTLPLLPENE